MIDKEQPDLFSEIDNKKPEEQKELPKPEVKKKVMSWIPGYDKNGELEIF